LIEFAHRVQELALRVAPSPRLSAQTAPRTGLVTEIVPDDQLRSRAAELATCETGCVRTNYIP